MKAILINAVNKTVTQVDVTGDLDSFYAQIGCELIEGVYTHILQGEDVMYVDEEGLLKEDQPFFQINGYRQALAGNAIIIGIDEEGDSCDAETPVAVIMDAVEFL